jgi:hypothetical protein
MSEVAPSPGGYYKQVFLALILCLLALSIVIEGAYNPNPSPLGYLTRIALPMAMLFNHLATYYMKAGRAHTVTQGIAVGWLAFAFYVLVST